MVRLEVYFDCEMWWALLWHNYQYWLLLHCPTLNLHYIQTTNLIIDHKMSQIPQNCFLSPSELMYWTRVGSPRCLVLWPRETSHWQYLGSSTAVRSPQTWALWRPRLVPEEVCWLSVVSPTNTEETTLARPETRQTPWPRQLSWELMVATWRKIYTGRHFIIFIIISCALINFLSSYLQITGRSGIWCKIVLTLNLELSLQSGPVFSNCNYFAIHNTAPLNGT